MRSQYVPCNLHGVNMLLEQHLTPAVNISLPQSATSPAGLLWSVPSCSTLACTLSLCLMAVEQLVRLCLRWDVLSRNCCPTADEPVIHA